MKPNRQVVECQLLLIPNTQRRRSMRMQLVCKLIVICCVSELLVTPAFAGFGVLDQEHVALTQPGSQANFEQPVITY
jgi:hypothetical protein